MESCKRDREQAARGTSSGAATNFEVGDLVLWSSVNPRLSGFKLLVRWVGLYVVTGIKEHCLDVITKAQNDVH